MPVQVPPALKASNLDLVKADRQALEDRRITQLKGQQIRSGVIRASDHPTHLIHEQTYTMETCQLFQLSGGPSRLCGLKGTGVLTRRPHDTHSVRPTCLLSKFFISIKYLDK